MADIINFSQPINDSAQVGDILYWVTINASGNSSGDTNEIGPITDIGVNFVEVNGPGATPASLTAVEVEAGTLSPLFMFRKNNQANVSTLVGYFAEVTMSGNSVNELELFNVGSEVFVSSK